MINGLKGHLEEEFIKGGFFWLLSASVAYDS